MSTLSYSRTIPLQGTFDIIVVGGGPSGVAAAIAAGRMGRSVALIEQTGCLGGIGTGGLVNVFMPFSDGVRSLVGGIGQEIVETLHRRGFTGPDVTPDTWQRRRHGIGFNAEGMKLVLDELVIAAGVDLRFFTSLIDVIAEGLEVRTLVLSGKEGLYALQARCYVDGTGDATLTAQAGFPCEAGDAQGQAQAHTLCSLVANVDLARYRPFVQASRRPGDWQVLQGELEQAIADGVFTTPDLHLPGLFVCGDDYGILNCGHLYDLSGLKDRDLTTAMLRGRRIAQEYLTFYRKYVPGCEHMTHMATAAILGVRETRRVVGEYVLNVADFRARRSFADEIGRYNYPVDIHRSRASKEDFKALGDEIHGNRMEDGESYGVPYRSLIPKGARNLLVAGRCISADRQMQGSSRVMGGCLITGHAAGVAAALCAQKRIGPRDLDIGLLRTTLRDQGAYLP
jgi:hypothetical protein